MSWATENVSSVSSKFAAQGDVTSNFTQTGDYTKATWNLAVTWKSNASWQNLDGTKGAQIGSGNNPATDIVLTGSSIPGTISSVVVNTSGASSISATVAVSVGGTTFSCNGNNTASLTNSATDYSFTGSGTGDIVITWTNSSSKAIYVKSVAVTYTSGGSTPTCATPTFSPAAGTYTSAQNVTLSTTTEGATIYYTLDGSDPTDASTEYSSAISVSSTTTIKAIAVKAGLDNSSVASATYTFKTDPALAFSSATAEATIGQAFTAPTLTNSHSVVVEWSSTNESVATVSDGTVTLVGEGTTTIKASSAEDATYIASEASYTLTVTDPSVITLWSEDFSSYSADDVPAGGTYSYACIDGGSTTKIYDAVLAGGTTPELLVGKNSGAFTAVVPLNNASGTLTLTYKTNAKALGVSTTTEGISGGDSFNTAGEHTVTFTGVTTSMTSITIVFTATSSDNVRLDDIVLRGSAQAVSVEAPTFSVNGGTYYTAKSVELSCATDGATIYYTLDGSDPTNASTEYTSAITVDQDMTIKAIAIKGSDQSTVSTATYTIAEKNDVEFSIADQTLAYGETYTVTKSSNTGRDIQTDGFVTVNTDNADVASVSGMTITAEAVGTTTITLSAAEGDTYKAGLKTITVTVTAPAGLTTAPAVPALFNETFDKCDGSGGRDGEYSGNVGTSATTGKLDASWATIGSNGASKCIKLGTNSATGTVTTSNIALTGKGTLTFSAAGWGSGTNNITVSATGAILSGDTEVTLTNSTFNDYTVNITEAEGTVAITFSMKRGFLDDVKVVAEGAAAAPITATLNASGYATYCSQYPLDFTDAETNGYSAWQITGISGDVITFSQITGSVKGGTGVLLKGTAGATVTLASVDSETALDGNKLVGTLAPTYAADDAYYGLSGNEFVKVNAGTVPAGKALLPANLVNNARSLSMVFEGVDGINEIVNGKSVNGTCYDLSGRRVSKATKGIYIVNGKKVVK